MPFFLEYDATPPVEPVASQGPPTSKYTPGVYHQDYCKAVVGHLMQGVGILSFARSVGVAKKVITKWSKEYPEFAEACERAVTARAAYWEDKIIALGDAGKSTAHASWMLKNIDPDEYKDKTEVTSTNTNLNVNRDANIKSVADKLARIRQIEPANDQAKHGVATGGPDSASTG